MEIIMMTHKYHHKNIGKLNYLKTILQQFKLIKVTSGGEEEMEGVTDLFSSKNIIKLK
jgi:hypothetical protein